MTRRPLAAAATLALGLVIPALGAAGSAQASTSPEPPTEVSLVVALTVPAPASGLLDADTLADYTDEDGLLTRGLDAVIDRPVTLGIDPMVVASIRLLGTAAPESAVEWLDRLAQADNDTFPLQWADADVTAPLQAGSASLLEPLSLDFAIDASRFGEAAEEEPEPTSGPTSTPDPVDPGAPPPLPTSADLTAWDHTLPVLAWPRAASVVTADLAVLSADGGQALLGSSAVSGARGSRVLVGGLDAFVIDEPLSALVDAAATATGPTARETALSELDTALTTAAAGSRSLVLALDRGIPLDDPDLPTILSLLEANVALAPVGLGDLADDPTAAATLVDQPQDAERVATVRTLLQDEEAVREFVVIAEDPARIAAVRRLALLATLSSATAAVPSEWASVSDAFQAESNAIRSAVQIVRSSDITLWADRGSLPVTVENNLSQAVTVYVRVRPSLPLLRVENSFVELTIEPNSQRKAQIPVQSISNGDIDLEISLHRDDSTLVGTVTHVRTTVQAGWETPVTIVAAILVGLVFVAGVVRTILRRRRVREEAGDA